MFRTTLRIPDPLARFLHAEARGASLSVNAWLTWLLEREQADRGQRLARDWAAYAAEDRAQEVEYALKAQAEVLDLRACPSTSSCSD